MNFLKTWTFNYVEQEDGTVRFAKDASGNEQRPDAQCELKWNTMEFSDSDTYYQTPFTFYFKKGTNTISFEGVRDEMYISKITLYSFDAPLSYEEKLQEYLRKIDEKARRLKQLSDHLFRYALVAGEESPRLEKPEQYRELFYDLLSETCSYLGEKGFQTEVHMDWEAKRIRADRTYVVRILDNITSNIVKYAGKNEPVVICCDVSCGAVRLTFVNGIGIPEGTVESTRIGLVNVKNMMERMGGTCRTEQSRERFSLTLLFPCI